MFNVQSYIAPLILSKLEKYIKNINENDFKVSLWHGDVVFENLELKVDVLEEEFLQLPFTFLSGHISNLKIEIPWTKIAYEPVVITISTVDVVTKLKDFGSPHPAQKPKLKKKISNEEDSSSGYVKSLISKIINNISIICNNINLKFIDEDLIFSMNIQHLSLHSADERWKRSFVDVTNASNITIRKLTNIIDLTICLDKRNSSGKIEFVQEPLLYKCSMELRMQSKYGSPAKFSITRIDLQSKSININISSQQFPMLWRLYGLVLALKTGDFQRKYFKIAENASPLEELENDESWLSWMWNMVPTILPDEQPEENIGLNDKKVFELGIYAEEINFTLKSMELISDFPSTYTFKPILQFIVREFYNITTICGIRVFNVRGGAEFFKVKALDDCPCDNFVTEENVLSAGTLEPKNRYLNDSYFDKSAINVSATYEDKFNNYFEKNCEDTLLARSSAMAYDIFHSVEIPNDSRSSDFGSDLEFSNLSEIYVIRVYGNGFSINFGADTIHRIEKLLQYYNECDTLPYVEKEMTVQRNQLSPATADDYDALVNEVPIKRICVKFKNSVIMMRKWDHAFDKISRTAKKPNLIEPSQKSSEYLQLKIDEILLELKDPLYKNRLIYTVCQLPDSLNCELFKKCFFNINIIFKGIKIEVQHDYFKRVGEILKINVDMQKLIYPHLWEDIEVKKSYIDIEINGVSVMMNAPQLILVHHIVSSMLLRQMQQELGIEFLRNINNSELVVLQLTSRIIETNIFELNDVHLCNFHVSDLIGITWKSGQKSIVLNMPDEIIKSPDFISLKRSEKKRDIMLKFSLQVPKNQSFVPVVTISTCEGCLHLNSFLQEFLSFEVPKYCKIERHFLPTRQNSNSNNYQINSVQSVHSSEFEDTLLPQTCELEIETEKTFYQNFEKYKTFVINIELKSMQISYSSTMLETSKVSESISKMINEQKNESFIVKFPKIHIHSVRNKLQSDLVSPHFPGNLPSIVWGNERNLMWNLILEKMSVYTIREKTKIEIIQDLSINMSIADESTLSKDKTFSLNILIETSPLYVNLQATQLDLLMSLFNQLKNFSLLTYLQMSTKTKESEKNAILEESSTSADIKEFLCLATGSTTTKTSHAEEFNKGYSILCNLYIQWICSKISLAVVADDLQIYKKLVFELEEILLTLQQQEFYQLKCKVACASGILYDRIEDKWIKNLDLGFNVQTDDNTSDSNGRFLDITITRADTSNVYTKWNLQLKKNSRLIHYSVTEINIVLQSFDIIFKVDELLNFIPFFKMLENNSRPDDSSFLQYAGSQLPLIHFMCNGVRILLPCPQKSSHANDVLIFKINNIQITPTAVNNLIRSQILRPDIHSKAYSLGILDLVGSKIEDRQYQLLLKSVSLNSSNWNDIATLITEKSIQNYDNPASEWNNLENGPKMPTFELNTIFKDSSFSIIFAPCIKYKETMVAGSAIEINCINEMNLSMTVEEISIIINLMESLKSLTMKLKVIDGSNEKDNIKSTTKINDSLSIVKETRKNFEKKSFEDSGVDSSISYSNQMKTLKLLDKRNLTEKNQPNIVPFEFTFTGSFFKIKFSLNENELSFFIDTPNFYMIQSKHESILNISMFDLKIQCAKEDLLSTRDGEIDTLTGIKPSLIRSKMSVKSSKAKDLNIECKRSISINFKEQSFKMLLEILQLMKSNSTEKVQVEKFISKQKVRKYDFLKSFFHGFKNCNLLTNQLVFKIEHSNCNFAIAISQLKGKTKIFDRPEKIESNCEVKNLLMKNMEKIFLHPMDFKISIKIIQEYWKKEPLIYLNISSSFIRTDVWPNLVRNVQSLINMVNTANSEGLTNNSEKSSNKIIDKRLPLHCNLIKNASHDVIEHFQDDLRSGAFQFIESSEPIQELPLPYQIQIVNSEKGLICWRYPVPRALHKIKIFPVPFQTANQMTIMCKVEYYSQLKSQFEEFLSFSLNENETKLLDLNQNKPLAEVWRVTFPKVYLKRDSDDEEEGSDFEFQMHPKVLVACLRIDSYYMPNAIPTINTMMNVSKIELNILNNRSNPDYLMEENEYDLHRSLKLTIDFFKIFAQFFNEDYKSFELQGVLAAEINDYGCGNLVSVLKEFKVRTLVDLQKQDMNLSMITNKLSLKYSSAIGHSIHATVEIWKNLLKSEKNNEKCYMKFIIFNNTSSAIAVSQYETNELIYIPSQSNKYYQFLTDKLKQTLQILVPINNTFNEKSDPFSLKEGLQYVKIASNKFFIVKTKSITNYQRKIVIEGLTSIYNLTKDPFKVQYKRYDKDIDNVDKCEVQEFDILSFDNQSIFGVCLYDSQQSVRLSYATNPHLRTGEIPLREIVINNKPWLVKVPLEKGNKFKSYWVRIIRQNINEEMCRVLVIIWPLFTVKSQFPMEITLEDKTVSHEIEGCGAAKELDLYGTHEDEHNLKLSDKFIQLDKTQCELMLSYKLINRNAFFKIPDECLNIDYAVELLNENSKPSLTSKRDNQNLYNRNIQINYPVTTVSELSSQSPEELSCSLMLTLSPWCLIVNSSGIQLKITNMTSGEHCFIEMNALVVPFYIENYFKISINLHDIWVESDRIVINSELKRSSSDYGLLSEGSISVIINGETESAHLIINSSYEGKMRIIEICSMLVIANYSTKILHAIPFYIDGIEKIVEMKKTEIAEPKAHELHTNSKCESLKRGCPVPSFANIKRTAVKRKSSNNLIYFVSIGKTKNYTYSCPLKIQTTSRKCLNISNGVDNFAIAISILKYNDQFFLSIYDDDSPKLSIKNNTDFNLYIAQTDTKNPNSNYIIPHREVPDDRLRWFQIIPSRQKIFYTPPIYTENFPEITLNDYGLIFACVSGDNFIRWSMPIKIDETKTIIINLPMFGDVKMIIDCKSKTSQIIVNYINLEQPLNEDQQMSHFSSFPLSCASVQQYPKTYGINMRRKYRRNVNINCYLEGVNFTIYKDNDHKRINLISFNIEEISADYSIFERKFRIDFSRIQVDNELFHMGNFDFDFPVVLCNKTITHKLNIDPSAVSLWDISKIFQHHRNSNTENFSIALEFYENEEKIENIILKSQPIRIYIEDTFISIITELIDDCLPKNYEKEKNSLREGNLILDGFVLIPNSIFEQAQHLAEPTQLKLIRIEVLHILISVHTCIRMYIALDHSPMDFSTYEKRDIYTVPMKLGNSIGMHYLSSALFGAGWVVGSLEILGSPSGLARSLTSGFKDFVSLPAQGLLRGPWGFLVGLTQGSVSLVRNVTEGTVNSVTKLANSLARNLDRLTLDSDHIYLKTDASRRYRPQGVAEGFQQGLTGLGISLLGAIGGIARHPLQAKSAVEIFTGVGKGLLGVFTKPISGAAELVALTGTGMLQSVGYNSLPTPMHAIDKNELTEPNAEDIISRQLTQYLSNNKILFTCRGTYFKKNELKEALIILMSKIIVIVNLENDMVLDVFLVEKLQPIPRNNVVENLFMFKLIDKEEVAPQKYHVSTRTLQYIKQLSYQYIFERQSEESENEHANENLEDNFAVDENNTVTLYIDEITGKYFKKYFIFIKQQLTSDQSFFPVLDI